MQELSFTVPYLIPVSVNHYKEPCVYVDREGKRYMGYKVTRAARAYYDAVAIFARGDSVAPCSDHKRERCTYYVEMHIYLGPRQRGDEDNFWKCGLDALVHAGVIHSDAAVRSPQVIVHRDERDSPASPRTVYHITRKDNE